jgi:hypothetical protein
VKEMRRLQAYIFTSRLFYVCEWLGLLISLKVKWFCWKLSAGYGLNSFIAPAFIVTNTNKS